MAVPVVISRNRKKGDRLEIDGRLPRPFGVILKPTECPSYDFTPVLYAMVIIQPQGMRRYGVLTATRRDLLMREDL